MNSSLRRNPLLLYFASTGFRTDPGDGTSALASSFGSFLYSSFFGTTMALGLLDPVWLYILDLNFCPSSSSKYDPEELSVLYPSNVSLRENLRLEATSYRFIFLLVSCSPPPSESGLDVWPFLLDSGSSVYSILLRVTSWTSEIAFNCTGS